MAIIALSEKFIKAILSDLTTWPVNSQKTCSECNRWVWLNLPHQPWHPEEYSYEEVDKEIQVQYQQEDPRLKFCQ